MRVQSITNLLPLPRKTLEQDARIFEQGKDPYPPKPTQVSFLGYSCEAKTLFKKGLLPQLKKDIYGANIEKATTEHIIPRSKGGKTDLSNTVVCDASSNNRRGDRPLIDYIDLQAFAEYCDVFRNRIIGNLNGNDYISKLMKTVSECFEKGL